MDKKQIIQNFVTSEKCTAFEAKTYLEEHDYDLQEAIEARKSRLSAQREAAPPPSSPFDSPFNSPSGKIPHGKVKTLGVKTRNRMEQLSDGIYDL